METTIENKVAAILQRMESFQTSNPTEEELRTFSIELLSVRHVLDKIDKDLRRGYWYYNQFYARWKDLHENERMERAEAWCKSRQLDMFNPLND